uniref:Uncharacterized protein n=1 Tax=Arundo donax TaxID=35708 RepID=A0A0A9D8T5_ARUDO
MLGFLAGSGAVPPAPTDHAVGVDRAILSPISCRSQPRTSLRCLSNARSRSPLHILHAALALHRITTPSPAQLRQPPRRRPCRRPLPRRRPCSPTREGQSPLQHQGRASMFRELNVQGEPFLPIHPISSSSS